MPVIINELDVDTDRTAPPATPPPPAADAARGEAALVDRTEHHLRRVAELIRRVHAD
jgi:hypothetical protein